MTATLTQSRRFGVEIECYVQGQSLDTIARSLHQATGLPTEANAWARHGVAERGHNRGSWKVTTDGSLGYSGVEVVSPILSGAEGAAQLTAVMAALRAMGARVNRSCGLHVHVDANDLLPEEMVRLLGEHGARTRLFDHLVAASRRTSQWCPHMTAADRRALTSDLETGRLRAQAGRTGVTRYRSLNLQAYAHYGTTEWRQHQGTLNATKALAWVALAHAVTEAARQNVGLSTGPEFLNEAVEAGLLHHDAARHLARRHEALGFGAVAVTARYTGAPLTRVNGSPVRAARVSTLTPEQDAEAWRCRQDGLTWREVAERLGLGHESSARTAAGRHTARVGGERVGYVPAAVAIPVDPF